MHSSHSMTVRGHWRANVSTAYAEKKSNNWQALLENVSNVCFLVRQSLPLRGDGDRSDSNFSCTFFEKKKTKFWKNGGRKRTHKYSRASIQNEMMKIMALQILGKIAKNLQDADFQSAMGDEATDVSIVSKLVICMRWVDDDLVTHDTAQKIKFSIKDFFSKWDQIRKNLRIWSDLLKKSLMENFIFCAVWRAYWVERYTMHQCQFHRYRNKRCVAPHEFEVKCRGKCYDGCSTMSGNKNAMVA